jgi:NADPH:quinone reductase-like Zn-dependent oxidoreductase
MKRYILPPQSTDFNQLTIQEVDTPTPGFGEVLVKVRAVSLNYRDLLVAQTNHPTLTIFPVSDAAGEVVSVGPGVSSLKPGDAVAGLLCPDWLTGLPDATTRDRVRGGLVTPGVLGEYIAGAETSFVRIPAGQSFAEAATLPCAGVTAWHALSRGQGIRPGDHVVIQGTGGVSLFALQLAKAQGAIIILTSSQDTKLQRGQALGADHLINYTRTPDWEGEVLKITAGRGADRIIEVGGAGTSAKSSSRFKSVAGKMAAG